MRQRTRWIPAAGIVLGGSALLFAGALTGSGAQSIQKADTPLKVAEMLDCMLQPKFQAFDGRFGLVDRVEEGGGGLDVNDYFNTHLRIETARDRKYLALAEAGGRNYFVMFLHCAKKPAKYRDKHHEPDRLRSTKEFDLPSTRLYLELLDEKRGTNTEQDELQSELRFVFEAQRSAWKETCVNALPHLKRGERVNAASGDWLLAMRPIRAMKSECLGCHTSAKKGSTLGVMVYAVNKSRNADTPLKVAEMLDYFLQPKFQTFDGRFDMDHDATLDVASGMRGRLRVGTARDWNYRTLADAGERTYYVLFLHCGEKPAKYRDTQDRTDRLRSMEKVDLPFLQFGLALLERV